MIQHIWKQNIHSTPQAHRPSNSDADGSQGHVSTTTSVESPDSLRSLVSRTQTPPQDQQNWSECTCFVSRISAKTYEAVVKELQAAVKRDEVENNVPVQSLLTRTLGQSSTKTTSPIVSVRRTPLLAPWPTSTSTESWSGLQPVSAAPSKG